MTQISRVRETKIEEPKDSNFRQDDVSQDPTEIGAFVDEQRRSGRDEIQPARYRRTTNTCPFRRHAK